MIRTQRPLLIQSVRHLHTLILLYSVLGFLLPVGPWLNAYLIWIPVMIVHWRINDGACVLTNLEHYLSTGRWKMEKSQRESGFLTSLCLSLFGKAPSPRFLLGLAYIVPIATWLVAVLRTYRN